MNKYLRTIIFFLFWFIAIYLFIFLVFDFSLIKILEYNIYSIINNFMLVIIIFALVNVLFDSFIISEYIELFNLIKNKKIIKKMKIFNSVKNVNNIYEFHVSNKLSNVFGRQFRL